MSAERSSDALHKIDATGCLVADIDVARAFMLQALAPIAGNMPNVPRRALAVAESYLQGSANPTDLDSARVACWHELDQLNCDIPDPSGYVYRAAIATVAQRGDFADPAYFLEFFLECAIQAGARDEMLAAQLMEHYRQ